MSFDSSSEDPVGSPPHRGGPGARPAPLDSACLTPRVTLQDGEQGSAQKVTPSEATPSGGEGMPSARRGPKPRLYNVNTDHARAFARAMAMQGLDLAEHSPWAA
eukprot:RCo045491